MGLSAAAAAAVGAGGKVRVQKPSKAADLSCSYREFMESRLAYAEREKADLEKKDKV